MTGWTGDLRRQIEQDMRECARMRGAASLDEEAPRHFTRSAVLRAPLAVSAGRRRIVTTTTTGGTA
jgi:hypothetical protein